jgi:hypothetical protein
MIQYPYALYLDSKIIGAARQLVAFFKQGVFDKNKTVIYLKKYKESAKLYSKIFSEESIAYQFMKPSELDNLEGQIIFYAFNAQSNCRLVANRKLKHIFITHGESNKISSIKPIIRIYDHVVMSGELSLERYYKSGLFDQHDYDTGRLIMMGNTFIGSTGFNNDVTKEHVLFYAPTWEGGLESENYSSLKNVNLVYLSIVKLSERLGVKTIVVQPHPNIGHRDSYTIKALFDLLSLLSSNGYKVFLHENNIRISRYIKFRLERCGIVSVDCLYNFYAQHALVDMSAMEFQCINENIVHQVFYSSEMLRDDIPDFFQKKYKLTGINLNGKEEIPSVLEKCHKESVISYSDEHISTVDRIDRVELMVKKVNK